MWVLLAGSALSCLAGEWANAGAILAIVLLNALLGLLALAPVTVIESTKLIRARLLSPPPRTEGSGLPDTSPVNRKGDKPCNLS